MVSFPFNSIMQKRAQSFAFKPETIVFKHPSSIDLEEERCLGMVSSSPWVENGPFIFQIPKGWILEVKNGRLEYHPPEAF